MCEILLEHHTEHAERIARHLVERLRACEIVDSPFQHFHLTGVLQDDIYSAMRANMPLRECYLPLNIKRWHNTTGQSTRDRLVLSGGEMGLVPEAIRPLWQAVTSALLSREVQQALYSILRKDIAMRMKCAEEDVLKQEAYGSVLLVRDLEDYHLKPHPDGHPRVATMMIYLADADSPADLGTSLYRKRPMLQRLLSKKFEEIGRFPFVPNSAGTFVVNDLPDRKSWHGRELITGFNVVRDSLILSYLYESQPKVGSKLIY